MIGSVMKHMSFFKHFKHVLIDECHLVNPEKGMYKEFFEDEQRKVIGLTATPYRLCSGRGGAMLKFITRTRPKVFTDVIYHCQVSELLAKGFLASLKYYDITKLDLSRVRTNSTGADYDEKSLLQEFERVDIYKDIVGWTKRLLNPKSGIPRKGILIFTRFIREAEKLASEIPNCAIVSGSTPKEERARILKGFKDGRIKVVANVGVLTTGFDYPELDTVVLARPTKSLSLYYQMVGRVIRPCQGKEGWVVDLSGNFRRFGRVEELRIEQPEKGKWCIMSRGRQLTNVVF
jgi:DNA repair protein RadD